MAKVNKEDLSYLTDDFQQRLILQILTDRKFGTSIIDILEPSYFKDNYLKIIVAEIKNAYDKHEAIPDLGSLKSRVFEKNTTEVEVNFFNSQFAKIEKSTLNDTLYVQETAMKFCKRQELKKAVKDIDVIITNGRLDEYDDCETILRKALDKGDNKDDGIDVFDDIESVLEDDYRNPIPTGISGLDTIMGGGLSKGELAVILAAFGIGKTTMFTKIANHAYNEGYNVLQIFFEDMPKVIQRKHLSCWTGINLSDLGQHKDIVNERLKETQLTKNKLRLKKFPSSDTTMTTIKQYIRKQIAGGFRPDIVLIDYIDCVQPSKKVDDVNIGEGQVMREFESMLAELEMAGWTAVQGNRSAISSTIVESDQMGGSIKKGQIGHFIVSIAKSLEQKENGTANMAILKSRFGKDGLVFEDIIFNNGTIQIEMNNKTNNAISVSNLKSNNTNKAMNKVSSLMDAALKAREGNSEN
jgi:replicative DNA helicase